MSAKQPLELSKNEVDVLLGLYSGCECLWNSQASDYKQKQARAAAFRSIVNGLRLETGKELTINQAASTIRNVLSVYEQELKHVLQTQQESNGGEAYHSKWRWFTFLDSFLHTLVSNKLENPDSANHSDDPDKYLFGSQAGSDEQNDNITADIGGDAGIRSDSTTEMAEGGGKGANAAGDRSKSQQSSPLRPREKRASPRAASVASGEDENVDGASSARRSSRKRQYTKRYAPPVTLLPRTTPVPILPAPPPVRTAVFTPSSVPVPAPTAATSGTSMSDSVSASIANTLFTLQALMARSLSFQDHPSFVFAKHISNELDAITDYKKRKQCMLEIQQVILRYQSAERQAVKRENTETDGLEDDVVEMEDDVSAKPVVSGSGRECIAPEDQAYVEKFPVSHTDDHPPVHFQVLGNSAGYGSTV
ncbi:hypothetical protein BaRGS_00020671 [Batillaria attramentaria]|uniref:MADF domain-containing protein n=1 Tax=Batillaria attramentaria TaxID=370345 RepID=A0ABD0KMI9_9CAEN